MADVDLTKLEQLKEQELKELKLANNINILRLRMKLTELNHDVKVSKEEHGNFLKELNSFRK